MNKNLNAQNEISKNTKLIKNVKFRLKKVCAKLCENQIK